MRYSSSPVSFSQPAGRGCTARAVIRETTWRRILSGRRSSSFAAERLIRTLKLATPLEIFQNVFETETWFLLAHACSADIVRVLSQRGADRGVHQIRQRLVCLECLDPQRSVECRVQIDGRAFDVYHLTNVPPRRQNVETSRHHRRWEPTLVQPHPDHRCAQRAGS